MHDMHLETRRRDSRRPPSGDRVRVRPRALHPRTCFTASAFLAARSLSCSVEYLHSVIRPFSDFWQRRAGLDRTAASSRPPSLPPSCLFLRAVAPPSPLLSLSLSLSLQLRDLGLGIQALVPLAR